MNLDKLLRQESFSKWVTQFLHEYTRHGHSVHIQNIGQGGGRIAMALSQLFFQVGVVHKKGAFLSHSDLRAAFLAWQRVMQEEFDEFTVYIDFIEELMRLEGYEFKLYKGERGYADAELVFPDPLKIAELVMLRRREFDYLLPEMPKDYSLPAPNAGGPIIDQEDDL